MIRPIHLAPAAFLAACGSAAPAAQAPRADSTVSSPSSSAGTPSSTARATVHGDTLIRPTTPRHDYTLLDSATAEVDGDGTPERVDLAATMGLDERGKPLWYTRTGSVGADGTPAVYRGQPGIGTLRPAMR